VLHINSLSKRFGPQTIFEDLSWHIAAGVRIGLVGPNGAGKTTLLRILSGSSRPTRGTSAFPRERASATCRRRWRRSRAPPSSVTRSPASARSARSKEEIERIENALASRPDDDELARLTSRYGDLRHRFEALGGYRYRGRGARDPRAVWDSATNSCTRRSPRSRADGGCARPGEHLLRRPEILLLDEPTNHLDLESMAWLETFMDEYEGSLVVGQPRPILPEPRRGRGRGARARSL
jgi:ATP-binding cassette subfamily F protein 3